MSKVFRLAVIIIISLSMMCWIPTGTWSATGIPPDDTEYAMIDDYWPMDQTGTGRLIHGVGKWYTGHGPESGRDTWVMDPNGTFAWGNEVDRLWIQFINPGYGVWDLEDKFARVVLFPHQDHGPYPAEALEFKLWGSNDFDILQPERATWVEADLDTVYRKGWSSVGEGIFGTCNDDYVSVWDWKPGSGYGEDGYRYVKVASPWPSPYNEGEIDAVKGVLPPVPVQPACGWETSALEKGRTFRHTSIKIGSDGRTHVAYGGEQLYYAVRDGTTWHVQEVDRRGVGAYCSLALDSLGRPSISYYDAANGDLKYAYQNGTLNGIWGTSASDIYAVGEGGTILHYDGTSWDPMVSGTTRTLHAIWGTGRDWARGDAVFAAGSAGTILRYNGASWTAMSVPAGTPTLYGIWGTGGNSIFAVGANGAVLFYNGVAWSFMSSGTTQALRGVWGSSASNVFAVGDAGTIRRYDGTSWTAMSSGTSVSLAAVWGSSATDVYAVGDQGIIRRYGGTGTSWISISSGVTDCFEDVWGTSMSNVFIVGCRGTVLRGGRTSPAAAAAFSPMVSSTTNPLYGVWGSSATNVTAVGYEGTIISHDGTIWTRVTSGNGWLTQTVDSAGDVGKHTSLVFSGGRPAISYYDVTNRDLKYARWTGTRWEIKTVDSNDWVGEYTSLSFDNPGRPAISYYDATNEDLKFAWWDGECWVISVIDTTGDVGHYSSLAFDQYGYPAVSYHDATAGSLKFARWNGSRWDIEVVDSEGWVGEYSSLDFDASDRPGISYFDTLDQDLRYASWTDDGWSITTIDTKGNVGLYSSLDFDDYGYAAISYYDATNDAMKVARWENNRWIIDTVDSYPWVGRFSSLAFDTANNPSISFYDAREGDLRYASWEMDHWNINTIDSYGDVGRYSSLAFDNNGNPAIAYYDASQGNLKYVAWKGTGWGIPVAIDTAGDVGSFSSLAFDNNGNPAIAYYDATNGNLRFCRWDGLTWVRTVVDSSGDVGRFASLDFDSAGNPGIAYYDADNGNLKYARLVGTTWTTQIVDSIGDAGSFCSLKFDCLNNPAISYYDTSNGDLKYAHWSGTNWERQVVDSKGQVGLHTSLDFDASRYPAISYHDASNGALKLARWNGESWDFETIDKLRIAGHYTSLAFDRCGSPAISYNSPITGDLKYAHPANPAPNRPLNKLPSDGQTRVSLTPTLECEAFTDPCPDSHRASQWLITTENCEIACEIVFDSGVDTTNLLKIKVPVGFLQPITTYYWSVRHQDCHGRWSRYSVKTAFTTESPPHRPVNISPEDGATGIALTPNLVASAFSDPEEGDWHVASQWQIFTGTGDNLTVLFDRTVQRVNLTQITVPAGMLANKMNYHWRVRYQDNHGTWSEFSELTLFSTNSVPDRPLNQQPADGETGVSITCTLVASQFADADAGETHKASQWRITKVAGNYSSPVFSSGDDTSNLTEITIPEGILEYGTTYYWQVRYQDSQGSWSAWSAETGFTTEGPPAVPVALIIAASAVAVVAASSIAASLVVPL